MSPAVRSDCGAFAVRVGVVDPHLIGIVDVPEHDIVSNAGKGAGTNRCDDGRTRAQRLGDRATIDMELSSVKAQLPCAACHKRPLGGTGGRIVARLGKSAHIDRRHIGVAGFIDVDHGKAGRAAGILADGAAGVGQLRPCRVNLIDMGHGAGLPLRTRGRKRKRVAGRNRGLEQLVLGG